METQTITIEKMVEGGWGLARRDAEVLLVSGAVPGERVGLVEERKRKGYREAKAGTIIEASPDRVDPPCPVFGLCGGCQLQHIRYAAQLELKRRMLTETLRRVGQVTVEDVPLPVPSPEPYAYRSVVRFVVFRAEGRFRLGLHRRGSDDPVPAAGCLLVPEPLRATLAAVDARLSAQARLPLLLQSIEVRGSRADGRVLLVHRTGPGARAGADRLVDLFRDLPVPAGQVVVATDGKRTQRWVDGRDWIEERLLGLTFRIGDRSFMQANWPVNEIMSTTIAGWAVDPAGLRVLELYAGIGTLGLPLARRGALVTEVEPNPHALHVARHAAKANHVGRCRFRGVTAEAMLETVAQGEYDLVVVDPPRTGLSEACTRGLLRVRPRRLLYLSCDAPTLARDLGRLRAGGYRLARVQPFDMFPQTAHLETLVELTASPVPVP